MNNNFNLNNTLPTELGNQAKQILKGVGLNAIKAKLFINAGDTNQRTLQDLAWQEGMETASNSDFGLPVFDILKFIGFSYKDADNKTITISDMSMGIALLEVNQTKNIVLTPVQGRNGTIQEYVSDGDFVVSIRGVLATNAQDSYPDELVKHLLQFCKAPSSFSVGSNYLSRLGITDLIITNYTLAQQEGTRNLQPFNLECLSSTPFEIQVK